MADTSRHRRDSKVRAQGTNGGELQHICFDLDVSDMELIATLEAGESLFFDHRDPAMVKFLSEATRNT